MLVIYAPEEVPVRGGRGPGNSEVYKLYGRRHVRKMVGALECLLRQLKEFSVRRPPIGFPSKKKQTHPSTARTAELFTETLFKSVRRHVKSILENRDILTVKLIL